MPRRQHEIVRPHRAARKAVHRAHEVRARLLLAILDSVAAHYDDDWWFLGLHAFASIEAGHVEAGRRRVDRALALNPRSANAAHVFAHACYESGADDEGARFLDRFLALNGLAANSRLAPGQKVKLVVYGARSRS